MLVDVLNEGSQESVLDGVLLYRFIGDEGITQGSYLLDRNHSAGQQIELFFCCGGSLALQFKNGTVIQIRRDEIILLSDFSDLISVSVQEPPIGYCLVIDSKTCSAFDNIYQALGYAAWNWELIPAFLQKHGGYLQIQHGSWNQNIFSILHSLPEPEQGSYCVLKAAEFFYLITTNQAHSGYIAQHPTIPAHCINLMCSIGTYIENHLDEKLTISLLCRQFNLSPTTLKNKFREFYGQPIHSWILCCRIRHAAELLQSTDMTVLQIAQSVGYDSVSQFNVVFRRVYGVSPSLYRKKV